MTLRASLIRLASANPAIRPHLLPILTAAGLPTVEDIEREFERDSKLKRALSDAAEKWIRDRVECDGFFDADEDGYYSTTPDVDWEEFFLVVSEETKWLKAHASPRTWDMVEGFLSSAADRDLAEEALLTMFGNYAQEHKWLSKSELNRLVDGVLDEIKDECEDAAAYQRDPYAYHGVSRRDFYGSEQKLRERLIRIAAAYPEHRAALLPLLKTAFERRGPGGLLFSIRDDGFSARTTPIDPPYNQTYDGLILVKKQAKPFQAALQVIRQHEDEILRMKSLYEVSRFVDDKVRQAVGKPADWHDYSMPD